MHELLEFRGEVVEEKSLVDQVLIVAGHRGGLERWKLCVKNLESTAGALLVQPLDRLFDDVQPLNEPRVGIHLSVWQRR